jgi:3-deoxy-manno-octulosonate cytidylyltransferase (CMP-KDO synthetase)
MILGVIPCRLAATRLPRKPLADLYGKPMVVRVWERAQACHKLDQLVVATEDQEIVEALAPYPIRCVRTPPCRNGTERVLMVYHQEHALNHDLQAVINIQGDEPLIEPEHLSAALEMLKQGFDIGTLAAPLLEPENPARVKVVMGLAQQALYFSRLPIPRNGPWWVHLGVYAFSSHAAARIPGLEPGELERSEDLEQLRWLASGLKIGVACVEQAHAGVDTEADLERVRAAFSAT